MNDRVSVSTVVLSYLFLDLNSWISFKSLYSLKKHASKRHNTQKYTSPLVHPLRRTHTQVFYGDWLELWKLNKANRITILEMRSRRVLSPPSLSVPFFLTLSLPPPSTNSPPLSFPPSFRFLFSPDSLFLSSYPPFVLMFMSQLYLWLQSGQAVFLIIWSNRGSII